MTVISPDKASVAETNVENEILDLKITLSPPRKSMMADFKPSNSLQLKAQTLLAPEHRLKAVSEIEKLVPAKMEQPANGND